MSEDVDCIMKNMEDRVADGGRHEDKKFKLLEWQCEAIHGIMNNCETALSMGIGNCNRAWLANFCVEYIDGQFKGVRRGRWALGRP